MCHDWCVKSVRKVYVCGSVHVWLGAIPSLRRIPENVRDLEWMVFGVELLGGQLSDKETPTFGSVNIHPTPFGGGAVLPIRSLEP
jgi:hypothetical protein